MKFLAALLLLIFLCITYVKSKDEQCEKNGGRCVVSTSAKGSCERLPYQCAPDTLCCKETRTIRQDTKRKCTKTPKKCKKEGGACVSAKGGTCDTVTVDKLCEGFSCTCCLGDNPSCKSSPACKKKGGICINKKKKAYCTGGTIDANLCKGKKCTCCITNKPVKCQCGQANEVRIIGGEEVSPNNKYPWMVGIAGPILGDGYFCGGTLISDRYVITAAHCIYIEGGPLLAKYIKIGLADHNAFIADDDVQGVTRLVDIETYTVHKKYDAVTHDNDIALIKLREPLDLSSNKEIKPVCLPKNKGETYKGADGIVAGWGITDYDDGQSGSDILLEVTVPILSSAECDAFFPSSPITDNMLCAGLEEGGKDSCQGDSGGPLVVKEGSTHTLVGVVSWGYGCAKPKSPGIYARVTQYLDWIIENTSDAKYCS